jgi:hypothetical protein
MHQLSLVKSVLAAIALCACAASAQIAKTRTDTVDVPVGSSLVNTASDVSLSVRAEMFPSVDAAAKSFSATLIDIAFGDSTGIPVMRVHMQGPDATTNVTLNRKTLALYGMSRKPNSASGSGLWVAVDGSNAHGEMSRGGNTQPIAVKLDQPAFLGNFADLVVEALPRNLGVAYRVWMWQPRQPSAEQHLYQTVGREDIQALGTTYKNAWIVEDRSADGSKLLSKLWVTAEPPYLIRWLFFSDKASSVLRLDQTLLRADKQ